MIEHWAETQEMMPPLAALVLVKLMIVAAVFLPLASVVAMFFIWWERKVSGHVQSRVGPMHVGGWHGWAQSLADGVKLILKEDLVPKDADAFLFRLAPYLAFAPVFAAFIAVPFGPQFTFEDALNIGVLYVLAVLAVEVMSTILAGWSSNSKWSVYGAMREACQMVSYEIPLGVSIITGVIVAGTLSLPELCYLQGNGVGDWFIFHNPFMAAAFLIYFIAATASSKRAPFDLPESESELVAGYLTEYSGLRWSLFFFAEYSGMFIIGAIQAALFLGGWNSPFGTADPIYDILGYDPITAGQAYFAGDLAASMSPSATAQAMGMESAGAMFAMNLYGAFWICLKATGMIFIQIWIRWTLPRIRIDQVLHCCVKVLLPASMVMLLAAALWVLLVPQPELTEAAREAGVTMPRAAHLLGETPWIQWITQAVLSTIGVIAFLLVIGFCLLGWFGVLTNDRNQPPKSLFAKDMPVGREIAFMRGNEGKAQGDGEAGDGEPAPA